ncbi:GNAT family N-acetyltransferase [Silanimonas sp.]|jgi:RimJ/RimL family protein N-acetyltransferase|uniref:GNAT family N-acetyltransferase n=1 Tax=Silanimonas sp. TaxID=1929290 RepID=UPI0037C531F2
MSAWSALPTLKGKHVTLEPLAREHVPALQDAVRDGELWNLWYATVPAPEAMADYVDKALALREAGQAIPFVVRDASGALVGSTRFGDVEAAHRRVQIGWTWYAKRAQRTGLNTEAKALMLGHAFETLGCGRVEFRTHFMNHASRAAIARLGAKEEGVLRNHMRMPDGSWRDTVVFSIIDGEWPAVRSHLRHLMARRGDIA